MFSRFFIDRPIFATVLSLFIVIAGLAAMRGLPIAQYPEIAPPVVTVAANYPGASADVLEKTVAAPLETQIIGVEGMLYMSSTSSSAGRVEIQVTFEIDANGILGVAAKDLGTGRETSITVQPSSGLAEQEIERLAAEAEAKKGGDKARREVVELRNRAETLVYTCRRSLEVYGSALSDEERQDIERDVEALEAVLAQGAPDAAALAEGLVALESSSHQIYEAMLSEAGPGSE